MAERSGEQAKRKLIHTELTDEDLLLLNLYIEQGRSLTESIARVLLSNLSATISGEDPSPHPIGVIRPSRISYVRGFRAFALSLLIIETRQDDEDDFLREDEVIDWSNLQDTIATIKHFTEINKERDPRKLAELVRLIEIEELEDRIQTDESRELGIMGVEIAYQRFLRILEISESK